MIVSFESMHNDYLDPDRYFGSEEPDLAAVCPACKSTSYDWGDDGENWQTEANLVCADCGHKYTLRSDMAKVKVETITIDMAGKPLVLTLDQARELGTILNNMFGYPDPYIVYVPDPAWLYRHWMYPTYSEGPTCIDNQTITISSLPRHLEPGEGV